MEKVYCKGERKKKNLYCKHLLRKTNLGKVEDLAITSLVSLKTECSLETFHLPQLEDCVGLDDWNEVVWDSLMEGRV